MLRKQQSVETDGNHLFVSASDFTKTCNNRLSLLYYNMCVMFHCLLQVFLALQTSSFVMPHLIPTVAPLVPAQQSFLKFRDRQAFFFISLSFCCPLYPEEKRYKTMSALLNRIKRRPSHEYGAIPHEHSEQHFESAEIVRDTIIGLSGKDSIAVTKGHKRRASFAKNLGNRRTDCTFCFGCWIVVLG